MPCARVPGWPEPQAWRILSGDSRKSGGLALGVLTWPPTSFSRGWRWRNTAGAILRFFQP